MVPGARVLEGALIVLRVAALWTILSLRGSEVGADGALASRTVAARTTRSTHRSWAPYCSRHGWSPASFLSWGLSEPARCSRRHRDPPRFSGGRVEIWALVAVLPIATGEFSLGVYLVDPDLATAPKAVPGEDEIAPNAPPRC